MKAIRSIWGSDSGQALIEAALCMPVLVLFLAGAIDLGRYSQFDMTLASAARAGVQYGSQSAANAANLSAVQQAAVNDAPTVTATASSYYKCSDGTAPSTSTALTMSGTSSVDCAPNHQLLYVIVTTKATFKPIFLFFLATTGAHTSTAFMQVGS